MSCELRQNLCDCTVAESRPSPAVIHAGSSLPSRGAHLWKALVLGLFLSVVAASPADAQQCPGNSKGNCNDGNPCTNNEKCDGNGNCVGGTPLTGTPCNADNTQCTMNDRCAAGVCAPGAEVVCDPASGQCQENTCDAATGECSEKPLTGTPCNADNTL
jgi:hypothetical protein